MATDERADTDSPPLLSVENLTAGYGGTDVLAGVSLHVDAGEVVTILAHTTPLDD